MMLFKTYTDDDEVEAISKVLRRGTYLIDGPEVDKFEDRVKDIVGRRFAVSFNSGTTALYTLLIKSGATGEVILPALTYPATANAVYGMGAKPIFADIERDSLGLDVEDVKERITSATRAIVPVHFGGSVCRDIKALRELSDDHDILLIEDAAQSFGCMRHSTMAGDFGDSAMLSFSYNKIISTGAGGMIVTNSEKIADRCRRFSRQGKSSKGTYSEYGLNFSFSSINAAMGLAQLDKASFMINKRRAMAEYLNKKINRIEGVEIAQEGEPHVYQMYNVLCSSREYRELLREKLSDEGIYTRVSYKPVHYRPFYRDRLINNEGKLPELPVTEDIASRILTLPFHLYMDSEQELDLMTDCIREFSEDYI